MKRYIILRVGKAVLTIWAVYTPVSYTHLTLPTIA